MHNLNFTLLKHYDSVVFSVFTPEYTLPQIEPWTCSVSRRGPRPPPPKQPLRASRRYGLWVVGPLTTHMPVGELQCLSESLLFLSGRHESSFRVPFARAADGAAALGGGTCVLKQLQTLTPNLEKVNMSLDCSL